MASHEKLSIAAHDRKARLAQLNSLKRKQAPTSPNLPSRNHDATTYLSGRNYDVATRNVRLGFEVLPLADPSQTLEYKAQHLALETKAQQDAETADSQGLDLFKLQPKKLNWDLARDLEQKMKRLHVQTENAMAKLVRERVEAQKAIREKKLAYGEGEEAGIEGSDLLETLHWKEQEEARDRIREEEDEDVS